MHPFLIFASAGASETAMQAEEETPFVPRPTCTCSPTLRHCPACRAWHRSHASDGKPFLVHPMAQGQSLARELAQLMVLMEGYAAQLLEAKAAKNRVRVHTLRQNVARTKRRMGKLLAQEG